MVVLAVRRRVHEAEARLVASGRQQQRRALGAGRRRAPSRKDSNRPSAPGATKRASCRTAQARFGSRRRPRGTPQRPLPHEWRRGTPSAAQRCRLHPAPARRTLPRSGSTARRLRHHAARSSSPQTRGAHRSRPRASAIRPRRGPCSQGFSTSRRIPGDGVRPERLVMVAALDREHQRQLLKHSQLSAL